MKSSSSLPTDVPSVTSLKSVNRERNSLEFAVSGALTALRELELELELRMKTLSPEAQILIDEARGLRKTIHEKLDSLGVARELVQISSTKTEVRELPETIVQQI